jgi:hypothetical protein
MRFISAFGLHRRGSVRIYEETNENSVCRASLSTFNNAINLFSSRWGPGKDPLNSVHIDDVAGSVWAGAQWIASLGRKEANSLAGEEIIFHNDKRHVTEVDGMSPHNKKLIAPMFNVVSLTDELSWFAM